MSKIGFYLLLAILLAACSMVASTGDTASDPAAAQRFLPNLPGYISTEADSITDALAAAGVSGSLVTGNAPLAAAIAKIDDMIQCYQNVGAVAARVYTQADIGSVIQGQIPRVGALAIINEDRLERNFLNCALSVGGGLSAQAEQVEPCGGSGTFVVNNERLHYLYAATAPELCTLIQQQFPRT